MADFRTWDDAKLDEFIASGVGMERESAIAERTRRHLLRAEQKSDSRHQELLSGQAVLKSSIDRLHHARCVDIAILIVGTIAAIATVILLFR
jgi:hypothetical protein